MSLISGMAAHRAQMMTDGWVVHTEGWILFWAPHMTHLIPTTTPQADIMILTSQIRKLMCTDQLSWVTLSWMTLLVDDRAFQTQTIWLQSLDFNHCLLISPESSFVLFFDLLFVCSHYLWDSPLLEADSYNSLSLKTWQFQVEQKRPWVSFPKFVV